MTMTPKRELSDNQKHLLCKRVIGLEASARVLYLRMGEMLHTIREQRLYEPFWNSWHEYTMEFKDLSPSGISKMITIYEVFVLKYGYKKAALARAGGWTKLYELTKHVQSKKDAGEWLEKAALMPRSDLAKEIHEAKTGIEMRTCAHKDTYTIRICRGCGDRTSE